MITLDQDAPLWAQRLKTSILQALEDLWVRPLPVYTKAAMPDPTDKRWLWRPIVISDGASNKWLAISNGTTWRYPDGAAV